MYSVCIFGESIFFLVSICFLFPGHTVCYDGVGGAIVIRRQYVAVMKRVCFSQLNFAFCSGCIAYIYIYA